MANSCPANHVVDQNSAAITECHIACDAESVAKLLKLNATTILLR